MAVKSFSCSPETFRAKSGEMKHCNGISTIKANDSKMTAKIYYKDGDPYKIVLSNTPEGITYRVFINETSNDIRKDDWNLKDFTIQAEDAEFGR